MDNNIHMTKSLFHKFCWLNQLDAFQSDTKFVKTCADWQKPETTTI